MYPVLINIGSIQLYGYGLMMGLAFFLGITWAIHRAVRYGIDREIVSSISWIFMIGGVIGGRAAFLAFEESFSELFSLRFFEFSKGGMVFYGGLILAVLSGFLFCRRKSIAFLTIADIFAPSIALGHALGRLGCFLAGCCYGKVCDLPWAVTFTNPLALAPLNLKLHPTQLYEFVVNILIVVALLGCEILKLNKVRGALFAIYLILYGVMRPLVEVFRGDVERGFIDFGGLYPNEWLSTSTFISFGMILSAFIILWTQRKVPSSYKP